jgi:hypothetical protein
MKERSVMHPKRPIEWQESHSPFKDMIHFSVRGRANPALQSGWVDDHIAELCMLLHDDIDDDLWPLNKATAIGSKAREMLDRLADRVSSQSDERAASLLYSIATQAVYEVLDLYLRHRELFDRIAPRRKLLPCLLSVHPRSGEITKRMRRDARLGAETDDAQQVGSRGWFLSDAPANVYARAIIASVQFNRELESIEKQQASWAAYDKQYHVQTAFVPLPKYLQGLDALPVPITAASVLDYWRKGKRIILEEMPDFHQRPEWEEYRTRRHYTHGAKTGAIQHAIFKDILAALRTIAGANKRHLASATP